MKKQRADCVIKALSYSGNITYEESYNILKSLGRKDNCGTVFSKFKYNGITYNSRRSNAINPQQMFKLAGLNAKQVARSGSVNKIIKKYPYGRFFCVKRGHAFALIDGIICDNQTSPYSHINFAWRLTK